MEPTFELDQEQKQIKQKIFPYLKALSYELVLNQPQHIEKYMIDFLCKQGNYTTSGLTKEEKKELEFLRVTVKHYRELEKHSLVSSQKELDVKKVESDSDDGCSEENDDVMDDNEEDIIKNKLVNIKKTQEIQKSMKARISVSAEAYGLYNKKKAFVPKVIPKNEDQMNRIKGKIISSFIFNSLDKKDLEVVINAMEEKRYKLNENVITQGEDGDCLYIVETGLLKCYKIFKPGDPPKFLKNYESGDSFGELALLYNCPRAATIVCSSEESILWSLDRETFNNIVKEAAQKKREKYENFLKNVDILSTIDSYELGQICDSLKDGIYKKDDYIIKEGELGDVFYIIEEGTCNATKTVEPGKPESVINTLKEGDYFGERALIRGEPRYANIIVTSETAKVISLDRRSFTRLLGPIMDILKRNIDKYQTYCSNNNDKNASNSNYMSKSNTNRIINSNIASNNNLNSLNNIIISDNNDKINLIDNSVNDNNPINIPNNDLNDKTNVDNNNNETETNYGNVDVNKNLNDIISSDNNNIIITNIENNNNENQTNNDTDVNKNLNNINISENNDINNNSNNENNNNENPTNNEIEITKNLNDMIISDNNINENTNEKIEDITNNNEKNENDENNIINNEDNKDINDNQNNNNENNNKENLDNSNNSKEENENENENNNKLPSLMNTLISNNNVENIVNSDNNNIIEISEIKENKVNVEIKDNNNKNDENIESMKDNSTQIENKNEETDPKQDLHSLSNMLVYQNNEETEKENKN